MLEQLREWKPSITNLFSGSAFAAASLNFGPHTVSIPHLDFGNLAWGWCAVTALGNFDPDIGGHIVLDELKLVVRFPPGCTIFIPSALVTHCNTPIGETETRFSFAQYSAAALFRWVHNGCKTQASARGKLSKARQDALNEKAFGDAADRWVAGVARLSNTSDFVKPSL